MKTTAFGPFLGINNRRPDNALRITTSQLNGQYLRGAMNVDIDPSGHLRRRAATRLVQAVVAAHSLHMLGDNAGLYVRDGALRRFVLSPFSEVSLTTLTSAARMHYLEFNGAVYFSNGVDSGKLLGSTVYPFALPTPDSPTATVVAGTLLPGTYQVAVAYANSITGEEGGISASGNFKLLAAGALTINLPPAVTGADRVNIYASSANGEIVRFAGSVPAGTASYALTSVPTGREADQRYEAPLPAGTLFMSRGRLCSFSGNTVYIGLPFRPGYYLPVEGYIPFNAPVSVAAVTPQGTYLAADKTWWFSGDLGDVQEAITEVLPYGAVPGTTFKLTDGEQVGWFSEWGLVIATGGAELRAVMSENVRPDPVVSGYSIVLDDASGIKRIVSCGWCIAQHSTFPATNYDWDFNSASGDYGLNAAGLHRLVAEGEVDVVIDFGKINFGVEEFKRLPNAYLGVEAEQPMQLTVTLPDGKSYSYLSRSSSGDLRMQRVDVGKGLRANWFNLSLANTGGANFNLARVSFLPSVSTRRI